MLKSGRPLIVRRDFIAGLLSAAGVEAARAQRSAKVHRIALVDPVFPTVEMTESASPIHRAFYEELRRLGYVEGGNLQIERYSAGEGAEHHPELARDVVRRNPDLIFVFGHRIRLDFKAATVTIPLVGIMTDPVSLGIVASLARPGGNITGVSIDAGFDIYGKRFELLKEVNPKIAKVGLLLSRAVWQSTPLGAAMQETAQRSGILLVWPSDGPLQETEYRSAFATMEQGVDAVIVSEQAENWKNRGLIIDLAQKMRLAAIYPFHAFVEHGGLIAYGIDLPDLGRRAADAVDQILKGSDPRDIPIYQPTKFELSINLKTAKTLGIELPPLLVARADNVIE
jgi:putative tryptophan/tyrosine transport system substrate-binding protein